MHVIWLTSSLVRKIYKADCSRIQRHSDIYLVVLLLKPCSVRGCNIYSESFLYMFSELAQFISQGVTLFSLFKLQMSYRISWILLGPVIPYYYILSINSLLTCVYADFTVTHLSVIYSKFRPGKIFFYSWIPKTFPFRTCKYICYLPALLSVCFDSSGQPDIQFIHPAIYI